MEPGYLISGYHSAALSLSLSGHAYAHYAIQWQFVSLDPDASGPHRRSSDLHLEGYRCRKCQFVLLKF